MKNFYDLLDTKSNIILDIEFDVIKNNGEPTIEVILNNKHIYGKCPLSAPNKIHTEINLLDPIHLTIAMTNKEYNAEKETAIIIKKIELDNIEIIPRFNHLIDYQNDHNKNIKTNYLGFNGVWSFNINQPFYQWLHYAEHHGWLLSP